MAQWLQKAIETQVAEKNAAILKERAELFKRLRAGGWEIIVIDPKSDHEWIRQKDDWFIPGVGAHFLVTLMPGAYPMRIKSVTQLYRLAKGVA